MNFSNLTCICAHQTQPHSNPLMIYKNNNSNKLITIIEKKKESKVIKHKGKTARDKMKRNNKNNNHRQPQVQSQHPQSNHQSNHSHQQQHSISNDITGWGIEFSNKRIPIQSISTQSIYQRELAILAKEYGYD